MKKTYQLYAPWITALLIALTPFLLSSDIFRDKTRNGEESMEYSCIPVPESIDFCGTKIDLTRYDRRERMDRELMAFTYMHSTSLQIIKRANRYFPIVEPCLLYTSPSPRDS